MSSWLRHSPEATRLSEISRGSSAMVLVFYQFPHRTMAIGFSHRDTAPYFLRLEGCRSISAPVEWTAGGIEVSWVSSETGPVAVVVDSSAQVRIECDALGILTMDEAIQWAGNDLVLTDAIRFISGLCSS